MAIPFFSIDMSGSDWNAYLRGLLNHGRWLGRSSNSLKNKLEDRFSDHQVILLPSARLGFFTLLKSSLQPGDEIIFSA